MSLNLIQLSILQPASEQARHISLLTDYFFVAAGFVLLLVSSLVIIILYRYKRRVGDPEPKQVTSNKMLEAAMIGGPLLLVSFFFYLTIKTMNRVSPSADGYVPDVVITGHQWWWQAYYPENGAMAANEIHLPVGKKILICLESADVIHDWWIPEFGNKMDAIPGLKNFLWLNIQNPGIYNGACSEFCGQEHAWMRIKVYADSPARYAEWLTANAVKALMPDNEVALRGKADIEKLTCGNCHRIDGTKAIGNSAPDLTHIGSRKTLLTGILDNNEANLVKWMKHPQHVKPGANMPDFILPDSSLTAMAVYLTKLK